MFLLSSLMLGFGPFVMLWFVLCCGTVLAYGLSYAVTRKPEWHPIAFVMIPPVLAAAVYVYRRMVGVAKDFRNSDALRGFAVASGWRPTLGRELPARGAPFTLGGHHTMVMAHTGTYRGRTFLATYYRVSAERGAGAPLNFTVIAAFTDADTPVTRASWRFAGGRLRFLFRWPGEIALESEDFSRRWSIRGADARAAHEIFQPAVTARLLEDDARGLKLTWDANAVMAITDGQIEDPAVLQRQLDVLADVADRMPAYQTLSGAAGERQATGDIVRPVGPERPAGKVERIAGRIAGVGLALGFALARVTDVLRWVGIVGAVLLQGGFLAAIVFGVVRWDRVSSSRRVWADDENRARRDETRGPSE